MAEDDAESEAEGATGANANVTARADEGLPWYVKAAIVLVLLIVAFILVIDLFEFAAAV